MTEETAADDGMLRHVLAHEEAHFAHKDHIWSLLRCLALILHWYNPLVWWAAAASRQDGELACDQRALACLGESERIAYGRTLLSLLTAKPGREIAAVRTTMSGGGRKTKSGWSASCTRPGCGGDSSMPAAGGGVPGRDRLFRAWGFLGRGSPTGSGLPL